LLSLGFGLRSFRFSFLCHLKSPLSTATALFQFYPCLPRLPGRLEFFLGDFQGCHLIGVRMFLACSFFVPFRWDNPKNSPVFIWVSRLSQFFINH
jgi:hypothetical protein